MDADLLLQATRISKQLLTRMGQDNDCVFSPTPGRNARLTTAVINLITEGLEFTEDAMDEIVAGEQGECDETYGVFASYADLSDVLNDIFEEDGED